MSNKIYAVIHSWCGQNNKGRDNGSKIIAFARTKDWAMELLKDEAIRWKKEGYTALSEIDEEDWKPGFTSMPDGSSWSLCGFEHDMAWATDSDGACFEKVEIQELDFPIDFYNKI